MKKFFVLYAAVLISFTVMGTLAWGQIINLETGVTYNQTDYDDWKKGDGPYGTTTRVVLDGVTATFNSGSLVPSYFNFISGTLNVNGTVNISPEVLSGFRGDGETLTTIFNVTDNSVLNFGTALKVQDYTGNTPMVIEKRGAGDLNFNFSTTNFDTYSHVAGTTNFMKEATGTNLSIKSGKVSVYGNMDNVTMTGGELNITGQLNAGEFIVDNDGVAEPVVLTFNSGSSVDDENIDAPTSAVLGDNIIFNFAVNDHGSVISSMYFDTLSLGDNDTTSFLDGVVFNITNSDSLRDFDPVNPENNNLTPMDLLISKNLTLDGVSLTSSSSEDVFNMINDLLANVVVKDANPYVNWSLQVAKTNTEGGVSLQAVGLLVPVPSTWVMLLLGLAGMAIYRRRLQK